MNKKFILLALTYMASLNAGYFNSASHAQKSLPSKGEYGQLARDLHFKSQDIYTLLAKSVYFEPNFWRNPETSLTYWEFGGPILQSYATDEKTQCEVNDFLKRNSTWVMKKLSDKLQLKEEDKGYISDIQTKLNMLLVLATASTSSAIMDLFGNGLIKNRSLTSDLFLSGSMMSSEIKDINPNHISVELRSKAWDKLSRMAGTTKENTKMSFNDVAVATLLAPDVVIHIKQPRIE